MLLEALHEVVNVLSALFNTPGAPHSKLNKLVADGEEVAGGHRGHARRLQPASTSTSRCPATARAALVPRRLRDTAVTAGPPRHRHGVWVARASTASTSRAQARAGCAVLDGGRQAGPHVLAPPSTYQPCATASRATRCRPSPPCAGSRSTAGAGIVSRRPVAHVEQPAAAAGHDGRHDRRSPCRSALEASSSKARTSRSPAVFSPSRREADVHRAGCAAPARAAGSSATVPRSQRQTSPRPSGSGRNGHASRPIALAPRCAGSSSPRGCPARRAGQP